MSKVDVIKRTCPSCGQFNATPIRRLRELNYVKCNGCHLAYSKFIPTEVSLEEHYNSYPRTGEVSVLTHATYAQWKKVLKIDSTSSVLDYGCGAGEWISFLNNSGIRASGVERNEFAAEKVRAFNLNVMTISDFASLKDSDFSVITMIEVIEHLPEVTSVLKLLRENLVKSEGMLLITTPNLDSLNKRIWGVRWRAFAWPDHLQVFNSKSLIHLLEKIGFEVISAKSTGHILGDCWTPTSHRSKLFRPNIESQRIIFHKNRFTRALKVFLNLVLSILRMGDTLTIVARPVIR